MPDRQPTLHQRQQAKRRALNLRKVGERESRFYRGRAWIRVRASVLREQPYCADPFGIHAEDGRPRASEHVDHVEPLRDRPDLAYSRSNLQGLCRSCHSKKTQREGVRY